MANDSNSTVEKVIATAKSEVGYREGRSGGGGFNNNTKFADEVPGLEWADFQPWCATFVSWVALKSGVADLYPRTASCDQAGLWFKARKAWSEYPAVGAQVFYGSSRDLSHTGVVVSYDADEIVTVEGNTNDTGSREGNGVYLKTRRRRDAHVVGYGYPFFPEGIDSADPAWRKRGGPGRAAGGKAGKPAPKAKEQPADPLRIDGVDISHWQDDPLDFVAAKAAGVRFVVHKATDGTAFVDEKYDARRDLVADAGLVWGAYHFARPGRSSGAKQAQFFLSRMRPESGDLRPVLDLEKTGGLGSAALAAWAKDFAEEVQLRAGAAPIIYTPFDLGEFLGPLWVARYNDDNRQPRIPEPWVTYSVWQFSNGELGRPDKVPGLGRVDLNMLGAGVNLDDLRLETEQVDLLPKQRSRAAVTRALDTNTDHVAALRALRRKAAQAIADEAMAAMEKERLALEALGAL